MCEKIGCSNNKIYGIIRIGGFSFDVCKGCFNSSKLQAKEIEKDLKVKPTFTKNEPKPKHKKCHHKAGEVCVKCANFPLI